MIRERVAEDVYVFTSESYAQVNAGAVVGEGYSVLIDTMAYPEETLEIKDFIEKRLGCPVRYLINTHHHADHSLGNFWFPHAVVISHALCRELLDTKGRRALQKAKEQNRELGRVEIKLPDVVFDQGILCLKVGKRTLELIPFPGHSRDGIGVLFVEERILFSGDVMMPIPYLVDGDYDVMVENLKRIPRMRLENLVQGHGDVVLRGEVSLAVKENLKYMAAVHKHARIALRRRDPEGYLEAIDVESCGKSRILLNGLAEELHRRNLFAMYQRLKAEKESKERALVGDEGG
jgi:glyoxylase-like metal-dependent hydrolase (beta-lactamase superfamily II)